MQITKIIRRAWLIAVLMTLGLTTTHAQYVYVADTGLALTNPAAWVGGVPATASQIATWNNTVQVNTTSTLGTNLTWAGIRVLDPLGLITIAGDGNALTNGASGIDLSLATNTSALTLNNKLSLGANQTWQVTNGVTLTVAGVVSGSSLLNLNNGGNNIGTIILSATNTYTGGTVINSGVAQPNTITAFGTGTVTNNGGVLELTSFPSGGVMTNAFNVTGTSLIDMAGKSLSFIFNGAWSGNGAILVTNDTASGSTLTFGGATGGNMANFTGSIVVITNFSGTPSAGTIRFNNGGSSVNTGNANMSVNLGTNSTVKIGNRDVGTTSIGELTGGPGTQIAGPTGAAGTEVWSIGGKNTSVTFAGNFVNNAANEIVALTKVGSGTFTLTGTNYGNVNGLTGPVTISAGTLQIGDGNADGTLLGGAIANSAALVFNRPDSYIISNNISGGGTVTIQAGGTDTYTGTNTSSGTTLISQGDLVLGASGLMSCPISVGSGATFDISQNPTFTLNQTLSGSGSINGLVTAIGGSINPGVTGAAGILTFLSGLTESGGINNQFVLSTPNGTNDLINVVGNLTLTGINNITFSEFGGGTIPSGTYPLIAYNGTLSGDTTNFSVTAVGVIGMLTNITTTTPPEIAVIISPAGRGATNLTWKGDGILNNWDTSSSNWVNSSTSFAFQAGDSVLFNDAGAPNTNVNLVVAALPNSVTFSNTLHYTLNGNGSIGGPIGLNKTNSGTLTVLTTNTYTGPTIIGQGVLEVQNVGVSGTSSGIGAASGNPTNLVFYGSTLRYSGTTGTTDHGATLNGSGGIFDVISGSALTLNGIITGAGALTLIDNGTLTLANPNTYAGGTIISNGVLALGSNNANNNGAGGSGVGPTNDLVTFNGGTLQLYGAGLSTGNNYNTFYNPLVVPVGQVGTLRMFPRGQVNTGTGAGLNSSLSGSGTLNLVVNYVRDALSGNWSAFSGLILVTNLNVSGDEMRINNNFGYTNAVIYLNGTFIMDSALTPNAIINIGELGGVNTAVIGSGNSSAATPTWCVGWKNTTNTFAGTIANDSSITKVGTGTWYLSGQNTFIGSTIISNGVLSLTNNSVSFADGSITASTNIFINAGAFLNVSGRSDDTMPLNLGQVISGNGTISGLLDTTAGGTVSPGRGINGAVGTLTVTSNINLGGTAWMKLNRSASPNSDHLVSGPASTINYGGTLIVTNIGAKLQVGDSFTLFVGTSLTGSFGSLQLPNYYSWDTSQLSINGTIRVTAILPPPSFTSIDTSQLASSGIIVFHAINGAPNAPVNLLTSTNLTLPIAQWTVLFTGNFDGSGNFNYTTDGFDPNAPQEFYLLQTQ
jgi:fibronectin-binding autotransporter adhesin